MHIVNVKNSVDVVVISTTTRFFENPTRNYVNPHILLHVTKSTDIIIVTPNDSAGRKQYLLLIIMIENIPKYLNK
jgi:hypothetical protein